MPMYDNEPSKVVDAERPLTFEVHGHRGARGLLPENTVAGFAKALRLGVHGLEMDVVMAGDGTVVVSHEPWFHAATCTLPSGEPISRWRQRSYRIFEMSMAEVRQFDCGQRQHPSFPEQTPQPAVKPTLHEAIKAAEAHAEAHERPAPIYSIEVKSKQRWEGRYHPAPSAYVNAIREVLQEVGVMERSRILSFDRRILQQAHMLDGRWNLALLINRFPRWRLSRHLTRLGFVPDVCSPDHRLVTPSVVRRVHERGMRLIPWTVNAFDRMRALQAMGVDGLITDYPDRGMALIT